MISTIRKLFVGNAADTYAPAPKAIAERQARTEARGAEVQDKRTRIHGRSARGRHLAKVAEAVQAHLTALRVLVQLDQLLAAAPGILRGHTSSIEDGERMLEALSVQRPQVEAARSALADRQRSLTAELERLRADAQERVQAARVAHQAALAAGDAAAIEATASALDEAVDAAGIETATAQRAQARTVERHRAVQQTLAQHVAKLAEIDQRDREVRAALKRLRTEVASIAVDVAYLEAIRTATTAGLLRDVIGDRYRVDLVSQWARSEAGAIKAINVLSFDRAQAVRLAEYWQAGDELAALDEIDEASLSADPPASEIDSAAADLARARERIAELQAITAGGTTYPSDARARAADEIKDIVAKFGDRLAA